MISDRDFALLKASGEREQPLGGNEVKTRLTWLDQQHSEDKRELDRAFQMLPGGPVAYNELWGESWQYMGTVWGWQGAKTWVHQFRHRAHPLFNDQRIYRNIPATAAPRAALVISELDW